MSIDRRIEIHSAGCADAQKRLKYSRDWSNICMMGKDRRTYPRVETNNLVAYASFDRAGKEIEERMARALNVSPVGILIETPRELKSDRIRITSFDLDGKLIEIQGKVVHCRQTEDGSYQIGVCFEGTHEQNTRFTMGLISVYQDHHDPLLMVDDAE
jgi:hypothetical protein